MVKRIGILIGLMLFITGVAKALPSSKVIICHHTGSQTNPTVTIEVSENAVDAHIRNHGDTRGACMNQPNPVPNPNPDPTTPDVVVDPVLPKPETLPDDPQEEMVGK